MQIWARATRRNSQYKSPPFQRVRVRGADNNNKITKVNKKMSNNRKAVDVEVAKRVKVKVKVEVKLKLKLM
jgi:hypothetical protein